MRHFIHSSAARFLGPGMLVTSGAVFLMFLRARPLAWDETHISLQLSLLVRTGLTKQFFLEQPSAMGPAYVAFLRLLVPGTVLPMGHYRWLGVPILIGILAVLELWTRERVGNLKWGSFAFLGIPILTTMIGLAMTDNFAVLWLVLAVWSAGRMFKAATERSAWEWAILAGLAFMLTVMTRQNHIILLGPLFLYSWGRGVRVKQTVALAIIAMIPAVIMFSIWGGIIPPRYQGQGVPTLIYPAHLFLSFVEGGAILAWLLPDFFTSLRPHWGKISAVSVILCATMSFWMPDYLVRFPMAWVLRGQVPNEVFLPIVYVGYLVLSLCGTALAVYLANAIWVEWNREKSEKAWLLLGAAMLFVILGFNTLSYSIRYVLTPIMLVLMARTEVFVSDRYVLLRWFPPAVMGLLVLARFTGVFG